MGGPSHLQPERDGASQCHGFLAMRKDSRSSEEATDDTQGLDVPKDQLIEALTLSKGNLHKALKMLLELGGDERSQTDPKTGLTKYHTPSEPVNGILRSSCTSNVPDQVAFSRGVDVLRQLGLEARNMKKQLRRANTEARSQVSDLMAPEALFRKLLFDVRERLRSVLELDFSDIINLFPSGTDAELLPALLAYVRAEGSGRGKQVLSLITASGEVGSGTTAAAIGQHFAKKLPSGCAMQGKHVFTAWDAGESGPIDAVTLCLRDMQGNLLSSEESDAMVEEALESALQKKWPDGTPVYGQVVVHMVVGSKTGRTMPSEQCLNRILSRYGSDMILPVIDVCQGRLREGAIRNYLDQNWVVLTTGSKFMGGPPFSGVCLMSEAMGTEMEDYLKSEKIASMLTKSRLRDYVTASLLSDDMPRLRSMLPQLPLNYGVLMRWTLALHSMEVYFSDCTGEERTTILTSWTREVRKILQDSNASWLRILNDPECSAATDGAVDEQEAALASIVSFHCQCNRGKGEAEKMSMEELRSVQFCMASDLSKLYPHLDVPEVAKVRCFMGQPVDLRPDGDLREHVLRVAASAPLVSRIAAEGLEAVLKEDAQLFQKLLWVLENWYLLSQGQSAL